jgi:hypothetical protein
MAAFVIINGVTYELHGLLTPVGQPLPEIPEETGVEIPLAMTAPSSGGFTASASSEYSESGTTASAWKAFDAIIGSGWSLGWSSTAKATSGAPQTISLLFSEPKTVYSYKMKIRNDVNTLSPISWVVEALSNGVLVQVGSASSQSWSNGEEKTFNLDTPGVYSGLRWRCADSGTLCQIQRIRLFS